MKTSAFKKKVLESFQNEIEWLEDEISLIEDGLALDNWLITPWNYLEMHRQLRRAKLLLKEKGLDGYDEILFCLLHVRQGFGWLTAEVPEECFDNSTEAKK